MYIGSSRGRKMVGGASRGNNMVGGAGRGSKMVGEGGMEVIYFGEADRGRTSPVVGRFSMRQFIYSASGTFLSSFKCHPDSRTVFVK